MSELLRELQEDMQRERWAALWRQYGKTIIGLCVAVVVGTAAGVTYHHWRDGKDREQTTALLAAGDLAREQKYALAETGYSDLAKEVPSNKQALLAIRRAEVLELAGKKPEADAVIAEAAAKVEGKDPYGELAQLQAMLAGKSDAPAVKDGSAFNYTGQEQRGWLAIRNNKHDDAVRIFTALSQAEEAPASLRERAKLVLSTLNPAAQGKEGSNEKAN